MRAEHFYADSKKVAVEDVPIPEPGTGEVLIKVAFCGICHSDLSLINGTFPAQVPVVTQGHEASGTIAELGPDVTGWAEGDRVIVPAGRPCTTCPNCRRGDVANCLRTQLMAFAYDGAWAEYTVAQAVGLTAVPDNVPLEQAAILADAVSTPYGAVVRTGKVGIGESVGVWGVGGLPLPDQPVHLGHVRAETRVWNRRTSVSCCAAFFLAITRRPVRRRAPTSACATRASPDHGNTPG